MACFSACYGNHASGLRGVGTQGLQCSCTEIGQHCATNWWECSAIPGARTEAAGWGSAALAARYYQEQGGHCKVFLTRDVMCFSTWLQMAVHHHADAGQPITNYITRPLGVGTKQFAEKPMIASNAWARLTKCLKALDMYTGQCPQHKERQHDSQAAAAAESHKEIGEAAMCNEKNAKYCTDVPKSTRLRPLGLFEARMITWMTYVHVNQTSLALTQKDTLLQRSTNSIAQEQKYD